MRAEWAAQMGDGEGGEDEKGWCVEEGDRDFGVLCLPDCHQAQDG